MTTARFRDLIKNRVDALFARGQKGRASDLPGLSRMVRTAGGSPSRTATRAVWVVTAPISMHDARVPVGTSLFHTRETRKSFTHRTFSATTGNTGSDDGMNLNASG
jgi:hypothetical protein